MAILRMFGQMVKNPRITPMRGKLYIEVTVCAKSGDFVQSLQACPEFAKYLGLENELSRENEKIRLQTEVVKNRKSGASKASTEPPQAKS